MAIDLGLHQWSADEVDQRTDPTLQHSSPSLHQQRDANIRSREARRACLGCYYLSAGYFGSLFPWDTDTLIRFEVVLQKRRQNRTISSFQRV